MTDDRPGAGDPVATTILSWVMVLIAAAGLLLAWTMHPGNRQRNELGRAVLGILGLGAAFGASGLGVVIAAIGLLLARGRRVRYTPLAGALVVNGLVFVGCVILIVATAGFGQR